MDPRVARNVLFTASWTWGTAAFVLGSHAVHPDPEALRRRTRRWAHGLAKGWGVEVASFGLERLPRGERVVLMANHQSHADVVALLHALPELPAFLAKKELRRVPLFGRAMAECGHIFIDRARHDRAIETIERAASHLAPGSPLLVFPEGTRGRREEISPFKKGGFHLARKASVPIVPIGLRGSRAVWPRESAGARPGRIEIHVGLPVSAEDVVALPLEALVARVRAAIGEAAAMPLVDRPPRR